MEKGRPNRVLVRSRLGGPFRILRQMDSQWRRNRICQQGIPGPTQNWWDTSWNICPIYARVKWTCRKNEPNIVHSCKHNAWGVQASKILLGWCNGHCRLCYCKKSSLWNWWKYSISSTLQLIGWPHSLPTLWMSSICLYTKETTWRKIPTTWKEIYHNWVYIWTTSLQALGHRALNYHLQLTHYIWWDRKHLGSGISSMEWPHCWGTVGGVTSRAPPPTRTQPWWW